MDISFHLHWTGHPLVDMGVAAVVLATNSMEPQDVTLEQWRNLMSSLEKNYIAGTYRKASSILFTLNGFDNPGKGYTMEKRRKDIGDVFAKIRLETESLDEPCVYFPESRAILRAARNRIPMIQGESQMNFYPLGSSGIPLSGIALGCMLSLPLVSPIVSGRFMIVAMDNTDLFLNLCYEWFQVLRKEYSLHDLADGILPERKAGRTRLLEELDKLLSPASQKFRQMTDFKGYVTTTLYHISNSGNGPSITIYTVPPLVSHFISRANSGKYSAAWQALKKAFWRSTKGKLEGIEPNSTDRLISRNDLYEAIEALPENALYFINNYFLRYTSNRIGMENIFHTTNIDMWPLLEIFLQEVLLMDKSRIEKIRQLADALADEIDANKDTRLLKRLMGLESNTKSYSAFRLVLIKVDREKLRRKENPLFSFDDFLSIFEQAEEYPHANWQYARDLIRIRCLETLYNKNYFDQHPEIREDLSGEEESIED